MTRSAVTRASLSPIPATLVAALALAAAPAVGRAQGPATHLTMGGAARIAAERSATAITAKERAVQTATRAFQQRASLLPSLESATTIDGGDATRWGYGPETPATPGTVIDDRRTFDVRLQVSQRVFDLKTFRKWKASTAEAAAAGGDAVAAAQRAAEEGAVAHLRVLRAEALLEARLADSALAADLLGIAREQLQAGTAIALDVTRAESQLAASVSQLITARSERARVELELLRVLGLPVGTRIVLDDSLSAPGPMERPIDPDQAIKVAFARRGEILASDASTLAAQREIGAARAERLPAISVFGTAGSSPEGMMDRHSYGIQVSVPLFDGFRREARIAEGKSREREALVRARDSRLAAEVEVRSALLDVAAARERVAAVAVQLRLAEQEVAQARSLFEGGLASNADVITASRALVSVRDQVVASLTEYHAARIGLASAQGLAIELR